MSDILIVKLGVIAIVFIVGFVIGTISSIVINEKENKALKEEADKFRDLYFRELNKWKDKYNKDDYEAY